MTESYVFTPPERPALTVSGIPQQFPVRRIFCVGQNYAAHAAEMGASGREPPFFFTKPADAATNAASIPFPPRTAELHFEGELVIALGQGGTGIAPADAPAHIFGYAAGLDLTRRDLQAAAKAQGRPWDTAKAFDNAAPIGPIMPLTEAREPLQATLRTMVNGAIRQESAVSQMIWPITELLAELSTLFTLAPGDLIFTGTPAGVGPVAHGDRLAVHIDGLDPLQVDIV